MRQRAELIYWPRSSAALRETLPTLLLGRRQCATANSRADSVVAQNFALLDRGGAVGQHETQ